MTPFADIDADTGFFLGVAWPATALCVLVGLLALVAQVAGRERLRGALLNVFYGLLAIAAISVAGLFLSV